MERVIGRILKLLKQENPKVHIQYASFSGKKKL